MDKNKLLDVLIVILVLAFTLEAIALCKGIDGACLSAVIGLFCTIGGIIGTVLTRLIKQRRKDKLIQNHKIES